MVASWLGIGLKINKFPLLVMVVNDQHETFCKGTINSEGVKCSRWCWLLVHPMAYAGLIQMYNRLKDQPNQSYTVRKLMWCEYKRTMPERPLSKSLAQSPYAIFFYRVLIALKMDIHTLLSNLASKLLISELFFVWYCKKL